MKQLITILTLCMLFATAKAQVKVLDRIVPNSAIDTYPTHTDSLGRGGLMAVATWQERNAIPKPRRKAGMLVRVKSLTVDSTYTIGGALNNSDWIPYQPGGSTITNLNQIAVRDYADLQNKPVIPDVSGKEDVSNKVVSFAAGYTDNTKYPTTDAVLNFVYDAAVLAGNRVDNLTYPNNANVPTTQAVVTALNTKLSKAISVTYADFTALISSNSLVPEQVYLMTDYQTIHEITNATGVLNTGPTEPLLITARTNNTFYPVAQSTLHPEDLITYTIDNQRSSTKGFILKRYDTKKNVTMPYDFRYVKYRRWKLNPTTWSNIGFNIGNVVQYNNKIYYCLNTHATGSNPETSPAQWKEILQNNDLYLGYSASNITIPMSSTTGGNVVIPYNSADYIDTTTFPNYENPNIVDIEYNTSDLIASNIVVYAPTGTRFRANKIEISAFNITIALSGNYWSYSNVLGQLNSVILTGSNTGTGSTSKAFSTNNIKYMTFSIINTDECYLNNIQAIQQSFIGKNFSNNVGRYVYICFTPNSFRGNSFNSIGTLKLSSSDLNFTGNNFAGNVGLIFSSNSSGTARVWTVSQNLVDKTFIGATMSDADSPNALADATTQSTIYVGAVTGADVNSRESLANKSTTLASPDNTKYPTTQAVATGLATKQDAITTTGFPYYNGTSMTAVNGSQNDLVLANGTFTSGSPFVRSRLLMPFVPNNTPMADGISVMEGFNRAQGQIDNLVSTKANLASPTFTGTPLAPTQTAGTNNTSIATTAFVATAVSGKANTDGSNATGTWSINTAGSADKWANRTFTAGSVTTPISLLANAGSGNTGLIDKANLKTWLDLGSVETNNNKATNLASPDDVGYPTTKAVATGLAGKANLAGGNTFAGNNSFNGIVTAIVNDDNVGDGRGFAANFDGYQTRYGNGFIMVNESDADIGTGYQLNLPYTAGTLALVSQVNEKADDFSVVKISGNQSISGNKTFLSNITAPNIPAKMLILSGYSIDDVAAVYSVPHGLGYTPTYITFTPNTVFSGSYKYYATADATNVYIRSIDQADTADEPVKWTITVK